MKTIKQKAIEGLKDKRTIGVMIPLLMMTASTMLQKRRRRGKPNIDRLSMREKRK